jgi:CHAT domain-containing protein
MAYLTSVAATLILAVAFADEPAPTESKPPWQRMLQGDDAKKAATLVQQIEAAEQADEYDESVQLHEELLALRKRLQGADHWQTADETWDLDIVRKVAALPDDQRSGWRKANEGSAQARQLEAKGQYVAAEPYWQGFRRVCEKVIGQKHPYTARSYYNLASNLNAQKKYAEAEPLLRKAIDMSRETVGQSHFQTGLCYYSLARLLDAQGKYAEAEPLYKQALAICLDVFGDTDGYTPAMYKGLAENLQAQGKFADAQPISEKALEGARHLFGDEHVNTAAIYAGQAINLNSQGKYADAQPLLDRALAISRKQFGDEHPSTALSLNNLAMNLNAQGKYAEAQSIYEKALAVARKQLGERDAQTALIYDNLGLNLKAQAKHVEARALLETALEIRRERLGELHPQTALSYHNSAGNLEDLGKYAEAELQYKKALDICREQHNDKAARAHLALAANLYSQGKYADAQPLLQKAVEIGRASLGELHPVMGAIYSAVAANSLAQKNFEDARSNLEKSAKSYEASRLNVAHRGLERGVFGSEHSPYRWLAAVRLYLGDAEDAWAAAENDLARGLSDEAASRYGVTLSAEQQQRQAATTARLNETRRLILQLVSEQSLTEEEQKELSKLQNERRTLEAELANLAVAFSRREIADLAGVQRAIPSDAALVLWIDAADKSGRLQEHWGCIVRRAGPPRWEPLPAGVAGHDWPDDDSLLARKMVAAITQGAAADEIADLVANLYAQRIAPLEKHLQGVERLFVVPVNAMAGVPVEVLSEKYTISYVPSGTLLARLKDRTQSSGTSLLALGNPVFPELELANERPLPPGGLLIANVAAKSNAQQASLRRGDVLLKYSGAELSTIEQLGKLIEEHTQEKTIPVTVWRDGATSDRELPPGKLGVQLDPQPAPEAIAQRGKTDRMLRAVARGGEWDELAGTAVEVARLKAIAGDDATTLLTRSAASEQELEKLRASGKLGELRYLHFATHGEPNNTRSFESALILSQDQITGEIPLGGGQYYDGRLTANEVLENWQLNADLVTLSACESALGRPGGGDGLLGFAQAFLLAGARAVCLSLWKVDDAATALLMERFYQNLLGKREGLSQPMGKAAALAEAKRWLRNLTKEEAAKLTADITQAVERTKGVKAFKASDRPVAAPPDSATDEHPYSHPRYWAAFVLIGDPD